MDIDLQGILLRILENGEVLPLFDVSPQSVGHLIVGIVNEDPIKIIREQETRSLGQLEQFFGQMVGAFLYEGLTRGRRLRPDLYYRLSRLLYVDLPSLKERREDIPILFYFECAGEMDREVKRRNQFGEASLKFDSIMDLYIYDDLMRSEFAWPGNIRQLQSVARKVATQCINNCAQNDTRTVTVDGNIVRDVLAAEFPDVDWDR